MKRTFLYMHVSFPITYDETKISEEQAQDVAQRMAEEALKRAIDGRHFDTDGRYQDCTGPSLAPPEQKASK